jgi:hypothetical protein
MISPLSSRHCGMASIAAGIAAIGGTIIPARPGATTILAAGLGTVLLIVGLLLGGFPWSARDTTVVAAGASIGMLIILVILFPSAVRGIQSVMVTSSISLVVAVGALLTDGDRRRFVVGAALLVVLIVGINGLRVSIGDPLESDVYQLHEQAADSLRARTNPYTSGSVRVVETHGKGNPEIISEYVYPPVSLVLFAGSSLIFGDSRFVGAIAVVVALVILLWYVPKSWPLSTMRFHAASSVIALVAMNPITYLMIYGAWTETITLPFLVLAVAWWRQRPIASAITLGLALATKQYFIVALPLLVFLPGALRWKRLAVVVATIGATFIPFLLWDAQGLIDGVVVHHLTRLPRPDALTVSGLGLVVPSIIGVAVAVVAAGLLARRILSGGQFLLALSSVIGVFTFFAIYGFRNNWWLVTAVTSVAVGFQGVRAVPTLSDAQDRLSS